MKSNKLIVVFFFLIPFLCFSQSKREDEKYINETKKLLSNLIIQNKIEPQSVLNNIATANVYGLKDCFDNSFITLAGLDDNEVSQVRFEIDSQNIFKWTNEYVPNINIVEESEIKKIFEDDKNGWGNFRKQYGNYSIVRFSKPIYLRNYEICIISYSVTYDSLGGYDETACYRKQNGIWEAYGIICGGMS